MKVKSLKEIKKCSKFVGGRWGIRKNKDSFCDFIEGMEAFCGKEVKIISSFEFVNETFYKIADNPEGYVFSSWMLES